METKLELEHYKRTKIIATYGPATDSIETLEKMIDKGANVFRINSSHLESPDQIKPIVDLIQQAASNQNRFVGILLDLQGLKIRTHVFKDGQIELRDHEEVDITTEEVEGHDGLISIKYPYLLSDIQEGDPIYLDDGKVKLQVITKDDHHVKAVVMEGGKLSNYKGVNLPVTPIRLSPFTERDQAYASEAARLGVDYIAMSFVATGDDVAQMKRFLAELKSNTRVIAKVERQLAVDNIRDIIQEADAVMVARGDLGVEIGVENVPRIQKMIITEGSRWLKPVIVATQMLETMIQQRTATRAEVSDVANAIYDRCDGVMLSGETAVGIDPINAVRVMKNIAYASDNHLNQMKQNNPYVPPVFNVHSVPVSICQSADRIAEDHKAKAIMVFTSSGNTSLITSKLNPVIPIIAATDEASICRQMALYRGVYPLLMNKSFKDIMRWRDMISVAIECAKNESLLVPGDILVITAGIPIGISNGTNSIRVLTVL